MNASPIYLGRMRTCLQWCCWWCQHGTRFQREWFQLSSDRELCRWTTYQPFHRIHLLWGSREQGRGRCRWWSAFLPSASGVVFSCWCRSRWVWVFERRGRRGYFRVWCLCGRCCSRVCRWLRRRVGRRLSWVLLHPWMTVRVSWGRGSTPL